MKKIALLGSTGSIGVNTLKVIRANPEKYRAVALAAGKNIELLLHQIGDFRPMAVAVLDEALALELKKRSGKGRKFEISFGSKGLVHIATLNEVDTVISAITGAAGLLPTYEAIKAGKQIALANKETMVMAGPLVLSVAEKHDVSILPIDSEHSAILQSLMGHHKEDIKRVILTASGGPFKDLSLEEMGKVTPAQALNHPNWNMGPKITIDSATMMNKGLEAIEARWLFDLDMEQISILIHPQSVIHSMVEYRDGSVVAQLGTPDMKIPISYALSYPRHFETGVSSLRLDEIGKLTFEKPDIKKFKCLDLALRAAEKGGSMPAVLNGANEIGVASFLEGKIGFSDIPDLIEKVMGAHQPHPIDRIETVMEADKWARDTALSLLNAKQP
ncbi:MAG: 1-deoxy-D-xylulose-5-phosphate reductoisomerase [Deltaproteobacteria bacterium]|nr:1-deoxy-D-xylulose-5-phosphate reductoisomerase [Deltaproteobacteria bacterium]MBW2344480.1 1-deoxy-D-xylulose-5-phosphate reductoisomerase [Deltaproteobacteria bacterium]